MIIGKHPAGAMRSASAPAVTTAVPASPTGALQASLAFLLPVGLPLSALVLVLGIALVGVLVRLWVVRRRVATAEVALHTANQTLDEITRRAEADAQAFREIQQSLLPAQLPSDEGVHCVARFLPSHYASGDYYEVLALDNHRLLLLVADVSGHGTAAAFGMGILRTIIHTMDWSRELTEEPGALGRWMSRLNTLLERLLPTGQYITMVAAILSGNRRQLRHVNAGHPPILLYRPGARTTEELNSPRHLPLKLFEGTQYADVETAVGPGDKVILYSDGLYEARNAEGQAYGEASLRERICACGKGSADALAEGLLDDLHRFLGGRSPHDDLTLLVAEIRNPASLSSAPVSR